MNHSDDIKFPPDFFDPPEPRPDYWLDNPDVRRAVNWFKSFIPEAQWITRREDAARRLYRAAIGKMSGPDGRFFDSRDAFGWYLFLAEALLDHLANYDYVFGSRVIPVFEAIGRNLDSLLQIPGIESRVKRLVQPDRGQPNGGLFEMLVAACYARSGAKVAFIDEQAGRARTHDMDVTVGDRTWAVECKRMEVGEYGERERQVISSLWDESTTNLVRIRKSTLCNVRFRVELDTVPKTYLSDKVRHWLSSRQLSFVWDDSMSSGTVSELDLRPLQTVLQTDYVLGSSTRMLELLTGRYVRNATYRTILSIKAHEDNPRFVDACDFALVLHWESLSDEAMDGKARDIRKKLSEATNQLPRDRLSIVHIGFEAVEGDNVERLRYAKVMETAIQFDPGDKPLEYICCHYFVPESPPDQAWAFDETTQWCSIRPRYRRPLEEVFLVLPEAAPKRSGPHWVLARRNAE